MQLLSFLCSITKFRIHINRRSLVNFSHDWRTNNKHFPHSLQITLCLRSNFIESLQSFPLFSLFFRSHFGKSLKQLRIYFFHKLIYC